MVVQVVFAAVADHLNGHPAEARVHQTQDVFGLVARGAAVAERLHLRLLVAVERFFLFRAHFCQRRSIHNKNRFHGVRTDTLYPFLAETPGPLLKGASMSRVRVLVGTHKGAFVLSADGKRDRWDVSGPHFPGCEISDVAGSAAQPNRLYAAQNDGAAGPQIHRSESGGLTRDSLGTMPARICQLVTALGDPDTVYAVGEDGAVLRSNDRGESWDELAGLREHAGGTAQPSILLDPGKPNRMYASLDTGAFRSDDAGETWKQIKAGTPVYRIAVHASNPAIRN